MLLRGAAWKSYPFLLYEQIGHTQRAMETKIQIDVSIVLSSCPNPSWVKKRCEPTGNQLQYG